MRLLPFLLALLLFLPLLFNISLEKKPVYNKKEIFDPSLSNINSVKKLISYSDSIANVNHIKPASLGYGVLVGSILRKRFYHGFSSYTLRQNWLAVITQLFLGRGLAAPVDADEILKYPYAGCSQQAIVMMTVMKEKKVPFRSVGFPHHYATELCFKNNWYFFDSNMEPKIKAKERKKGKILEGLRRFSQKILQRQSSIPQLDVRQFCSCYFRKTKCRSSSTCLYFSGAH